MKLIRSVTQSVNTVNTCFDILTLHIFFFLPVELGRIEIRMEQNKVSLLSRALAFSDIVQRAMALDRRTTGGGVQTECIGSLLQMFEVCFHQKISAQL